MSRLKRPCYKKGSKLRKPTPKNEGNQDIKTKKY